jgi:hypothetical protein
MSDQIVTRSLIIAFIMVIFICGGICFLWCILKKVFGEHVVGLPPEQTHTMEKEFSEPTIELSYTDGSPVRGDSYKYSGAV